MRTLCPKCKVPVVVLVQNADIIYPPMASTGCGLCHTVWKWGFKKDHRILRCWVPVTEGKDS